uniref:Beta-galactosidase n=1 Tax=Leptobrachium leishanense TaxID=445787 RepID=A0A8C5MT59_9ANUR
MQRWNINVTLSLSLATFFSFRRTRLGRIVPLRMFIHRTGLQAENSQFLLEDKPITILGGSMHYFRVPVAHWRDRMRKMKACGLNTLTTYVPWNLHEPRRGKFDFSGILDLGVFLEVAAEVGLWVILRPGPYICSEWDLGGLPSWLLRDKNMQLRTTYRGFTEATEAYFDELIPKVIWHQYSKGGPIIAVQVENEYGSYAKDANYMEFIKTALVSRGIEELLLTSDNKDGLSAGTIEGGKASDGLLVNTVTFVSTQSNKPVLVMEYWTGWFDHWGGDHHVFDMISTVSDVLIKGASINLYMFHGGTNFGFMSGALHFHEYRSDVTSYDYDAPLTEAGDYTSKYYKLRDLLSKYHGNSPSQLCVLLLPPQPIRSEEPINMENLPVNDGNGQSYGYTLYEAVIYGGGKFHTRGNVRDRAQVSVSSDLEKTGTTIGVIQRGYRKLQILVENCGRVNYGNKLDTQRKGLVGDVFLRDVPLRNFKIYSLDMNQTFINGNRHGNQWILPSDCSFSFFFNTFLNVSLQALAPLYFISFNPCVVFLNGKNLGRYWDIGPQETLYVPGSWLWPGVNEVSCSFFFSVQLVYVPHIEVSFHATQDQPTKISTTFPVGRGVWGW